MKRTTSSRSWRAASWSEPMPSSTPVIDSTSPSTWAPYRLASATTSTVCRWFSSIGIREASKSTEFHPVSRHRSEEHTSELQSHVNLVCRLLLEKKKKQIQLDEWKQYMTE